MKGIKELRKNDYICSRRQFPFQYKQDIHDDDDDDDNDQILSSINSRINLSNPNC